MNQLQYGIELVATAAPHQRRELLQTLMEFRDRVHAEHRDCECAVYEDLSQTNRFMWIEFWTSREALERAMDTSRFHALKGAIRLLGTLHSTRRVHAAGTSPADVPDDDAWSQVRPIQTD